MTEMIGMDLIHDNSGEIYYPDVVEKPIYQRKEFEIMGEQYSRMSQIPYQKAIVDENNGNVFAITSDQYKLIKYEDIIERIGNVVADHPEYGDPKLIINTINEGAKLEAKWTFPEIQYPIKRNGSGKSDYVNPSVNVYSSYDTSEALTELFGAFRILCSNGLVVGETFVNYKKKHTQNINIGKIETVLVQGMEAFSDQTRLWTSWMDRHTTSTEYEHVMSTMKFNKGEVEEIHDEVEVSSGVILDDMKTKTLTYWIFYNIIAQYITHRVQSDNRRVQLQHQMRKLF